MRYVSEIVIAVSLSLPEVQTVLFTFFLTINEEILDKPQ